MKIDAETKFDIGQEVYIIHNSRQKWKIMRKAVIDDVRTLSMNDVCIIRYGFINGAIYSEKILFATQEEAQTRCNELNKEVRDNGNR